MTDNLTKRQRTKCMSNIRGQWTIPERKMHDFLKGYKVHHIMHPNLFGKPDILIVKSKVALFVQGCFWHKCPNCYVEPKTNKSYWLPKIARNVERDKMNSKILKSRGYKVLKIWEHEIKSNLNKVIEKVKKYSS